MRNIMLIGLVLIYGVSLANANCFLFGCDDIKRDIDTDYNKIYKKISGHKKVFKKQKYYCDKRKEDEINVFSIEKNREEELLIINFSEYKKNQFNSTQYDPVNPNTKIAVEIMLKLDFGILGAEGDGISADKRCRYQEFKGFFNSVVSVFVCSYGKNAKLPISDSIMKEKASVVSIEKCDSSWTNDRILLKKQIDKDKEEFYQKQLKTLEEKGEVGLIIHPK